MHGRVATCPLPEDKNFIEPFHWYAHRQLREGGCVAGSVVVPNDSGWPSEYKFLFADFIFFEIYNLMEDPDAYCRACVPPLPAYRNETFHTISPVDPGGEKGHITDIFFGPYKVRCVIHYFSATKFVFLVSALTTKPFHTLL